MMLSRREFLKLSSLAFGAALLPPLPPEEAPRRATLLGRTIYLNYIYDQPSFNGRQVGLIPAESVFSIYRTVQSADAYYNRTWYEVQRGYVHSGSVQPVRWQVQTPLTRVPAEGFLGEVTVPFTQAKARPGVNYNTTYKFYYSTTHWITDVAVDEDDGSVWYEAFDDRFVEYNWVRADHIRRVPESELTPIAPEVTDKRIEVDLDTQVFRCL
jgi:hypothetical protein